MKPITAIVAFLALAMAGIALILDAEEVEVRKVQVRTSVTKTVFLAPDPSYGDGFLSQRQCRSLKFGTPFKTFVKRYGWPRTLEPSAGYSLAYPIREDNRMGCYVEFNRRQRLSSLSIISMREHWDGP
jgi:hypothetical protein